MLSEKNAVVNSFEKVRALNAEKNAAALMIPERIAFENNIARSNNFANDVRVIREELENQSAGKPVNFSKLVPIFKKALSWHDGGKIGGIYSLFDSTASFCTLCESMRRLAEDYDTRRASDPETPDVICKYCYDRAQEQSFKASNILPRHWLNMKMLSLFNIPSEYLKCWNFSKANICRFDSSGDIENQTHAENLVKIAYNYPEIHFALYSKNIALVNKVFDKYGKPANLRFIQSSYFIDIPGMKSSHADVVFTVYTADKINNAISGGACECNGKKCAECGFKCYLPENIGGWNSGANVAEKLRT